MNHMTAIQAAQQANRTGDGRYATKVAVAVNIELVDVAFDDAVEWWYADGSYEITSAAATILDTDDYDQGSPSLDALAAAAHLIDAAETIGEPVRHGRGDVNGYQVGEIVDVPLMSTTNDYETAEYFAESRSEDGEGGYFDFVDARGVRINSNEYAVTGRYIVTGTGYADDGRPVVTLELSS